MSTPPRPLLASGLLEARGRHGFSTRSGGVSPAPFRSLNLGIGLGDDAARVAENQRRLLASLALSTCPLFLVDQVHGDTLWDVPAAPVSPAKPPRADALIASHPDQVVGIRTADCVPILITSPDAQVVAAVHAGWRGTALGILPKVIQRLSAHYAIPAETLRLAIGPAISLASYEVGPEVAQGLAAGLGRPLDALTAFIVPGDGDRFHVDLRSINRLQALEAAVPADAIETVGGCTAAHPETFFSYRRDGGQTGRHLSVIATAPRCAP